MIERMFANLKLFSAILFLSLPVYGGEGGVTEQVVGDVYYGGGSANAGFTVGDGSRIELPNKGFSIVPPVGWEVHRNYPGTTLLLQPSYNKKMAYQRTIQVMRFIDGIPIDDITGKKFEKIIESKFSRALGEIADYQMRNYMMTKMADGTDGLLYYSEFTMGGQLMMQAHILLSSATHHFLLTYTDIAAHFEGEAAGDYLMNAWQAMTSAQLDSKAPVRMRSFAFIGFGLGFLMLGISLALAFRKFKAGKQYDGIVDEYMSLQKSLEHSRLDDEDPSLGEAESYVVSGGFKISTSDPKPLSSINENSIEDKWEIPQTKGKKRSLPSENEEYDGEEKKAS